MDAPDRVKHSQKSLRWDIPLVLEQVAGAQLNKPAAHHGGPFPELCGRMTRLRPRQCHTVCWSWIRKLGAYRCDDNRLVHYDLVRRRDHKDRACLRVSAAIVDDSHPYRALPKLSFGHAHGVTRPTARRGPPIHGTMIRWACWMRWTPTCEARHSMGWRVQPPATPPPRSGRRANVSPQSSPRWCLGFRRGAAAPTLARTISRGQ